MDGAGSTGKTSRCVRRHLMLSNVFLMPNLARSVILSRQVNFDFLHAFLVLVSHVRSELRP